jgi:undecaprenyl-diphosphatase
VSVLQAIVLGIVQGLTEYAPISSSGHLILVPWAFGWNIVADPDLNKSFDVALHMGTLLGAVIYFRHDIWSYLKAFARSVARRSIEGTDERLAWAIVLGTIPGVIIGALFESTIQDTLGQPWLIAVMLAVFGVVLWWVDLHAPITRDFDSITPRTGSGLGVAQAMALQPGISRSGVTMTAARWIGIDRESAARFSFLLSLPIIAGAGLYKGLGLVGTGFQGYEAQFFWGFVSSAISGFIAIWWLLRYLRRNDFALFMWFRLAVAAIVLVLIATGARPPTI